MDIDQQKLQALLTRLRSATGPDRELDDMIWQALCWQEHWRVIPKGTPITTSLDTTLRLVETVLPGCGWGRREDSEKMHLTWRATPIESHISEASGSTPALGLLTALVQGLLASP